MWVTYLLYLSECNVYLLERMAYFWSFLFTSKDQQFKLKCKNKNPPRFAQSIESDVKCGNFEIQFSSANKKRNMRQQLFDQTETMVHHEMTRTLRKNTNYCQNVMRINFHISLVSFIQEIIIMQWYFQMLGKGF